MYQSKSWDDDTHSGGYKSSSKYSSNSPEGKKSIYGQHKNSSEKKNSEYSSQKNMRQMPQKPSQKDTVREEEIPLIAAQQIFNESQNEAKISSKKETKTIEEAIKKAIEDEKNVFVMDK